jgi:hypothetical protein
MKQNVTTEMLLAAMMAATPARKADALLVLRGEASVVAGSGGSGPGGRTGLEAYVGLRDVAAFLNVSARSVKRWRVPEHKLGGRTRFRLSEVAKYMESEEFSARLVELREEREAVGQ